jgi:GPI transamidase subunit PIG-U
VRRRQSTTIPKPLFADAYRGGGSAQSIQIHIPPLALAALEALFTGKSIWIIATLILLIDLCIACTLEELARRSLQRESDADEMAIQQYMDPKIRPTQMVHLFPMTVSTTTGTTASAAAAAVTEKNGDDTGMSTRSSNQSSSLLLIQWRDIPNGVAHLYYVNPITILATTQSHNDALCFQNVPFLVLVLSLAEACKRPQTRSVAYMTCLLAVASYMDCHNSIFLVPMVLWQESARQRRLTLILYVVFSFVLQLLSILLVGMDQYWSIVVATHLYPYRLAGLSPSLSTLWYFGMEVFLRFRTYFEFALGGIPYFLVAPLTIRLYPYPSVLVRSPEFPHIYG